MSTRRASRYRRGYEIQNFCCRQADFTSSKQEASSPASIGSTRWLLSTDMRSQNCLAGMAFRNGQCRKAQPNLSRNLKRPPTDLSRDPKEPGRAQRSDHRRAVFRMGARSEKSCSSPNRIATPTTWPMISASALGTTLGGTGERGWDWRMISSSPGVHQQQVWPSRVSTKYIGLSYSDRHPPLLTLFLDSST